MNDEKISTGALLQRLFKTHSIECFITHYDKQMVSVSFSAYISRLCAEKGAAPSQIISRSGIERTFGHQLFNGRRTPSRDTVIQLAFGFGMDYERAQNLLKISGKSALYPRIRRDAVVIFALARGFGIAEVQSTLSELSLPLLGKEERRYG
ncbi:MAG: hypothetical protein LBB94_03125 [Clostridiales bacterium]|jgi:hypothetical protein|nr:hypothetical protein [Clostridiales bacterium]